MWEPRPDTLRDPTPLVSVAALDALLVAGCPAASVRRLVERYDTWGDLVTAPVDAIVAAGRLRTGVRLPLVCPPVRPASTGGPVGRWDHAWIESFEQLADPPVLVDVAGHRRAVQLLIGGSRHPSPRALRILDDVVDAAASARIGVCAVGEGVGLAVAERAVGRVPVTLVTYGDGVATCRSLLGGVRSLRTAAQVAAAGGMVVQARGVEPLVDAACRAARMAVALSNSVLLVEPGIADFLVDEIADTAAACGTGVVVTGDDDRIERSTVGYGHLPLAAFSSTALARAVLPS